MTRSIRCLLPLAGLLITGSSGVAQSAPAGWKYTTNMTVDSGDGAHRTSMAMRHYVIEGKLRTEFVQISNMAGTDGVEGSYQITSAADSTMIMVTPSQRMAMVMHIGGTLAGRTPTKIESHVTKSQVEDLGAGERILGHPTRHVRVTNEGTVDVTMLGTSCTGTLNGVIEMWIAPDIDMRSMWRSSLATNNAALGTDIDVGANTTSNPSIPTGTALRSISRVTRPNAQGRMVTVTTTSEYVELAEGPLDPSIFQAPADFRVMDMTKMMAELPAGMLDSAMRAGAERGASASSKSICRAFGSP